MSQRSANLLRDKLKLFGWGRGVQGRERAFLCALWPGLWMNQSQPDIPAKLCNHTPKWGGNLSWGCLFHESMGVTAITFSGAALEDVQWMASLKKPGSAQSWSECHKTGSEGGRERKGKKERIKGLSYSESLGDAKHMKMETMLHWKDMSKLKGHLGEGGQAILKCPNIYLGLKNQSKLRTYSTAKDWFNKN